MYQADSTSGTDLTMKVNSDYKPKSPAIGASWRLRSFLGVTNARCPHRCPDLTTGAQNGSVASEFRDRVRLVEL